MFLFDIPEQSHLVVMEHFFGDKILGSNIGIELF